MGSLQRSPVQLPLVPRSVDYDSTPPLLHKGLQTFVIEVENRVTINKPLKITLKRLVESIEGYIKSFRQLERQQISKVAGDMIEEEKVCASVRKNKKADKTQKDSKEDEQCRKHTHAILCAQKGVQS